MIHVSLVKPDLFKIHDKGAGKAHYGCDQEWYTTEWQRMSGCGPSVACNIISYLERRRRAPGGAGTCMSKAASLLRMQEAWEYVTPTEAGLPKISMFYEAVLRYTKARGLDVEYGALELPKAKSRRPSLAKVISFIKDALLKDAPVAFLNLCNGAEKELDAWHWVTIVALEGEADGNRAVVRIVDDGVLKKIDLALWHATTKLGGGFVRVGMR